jgi:hypothetical protein
MLLAIFLIGTFLSWYVNKMYPPETDKERFMRGLIEILIVFFACAILHA